MSDVNPNKTSSVSEDLLISYGVKPTAMRILVLQYFLETRSAVTLRRLEDHFDGSDMSTLFRTLKKFVDHKILHTIDDGTGVMKYAKCEQGCMCAPNDLHFHFHCLSCQETICLTEQRISTIELPNNFKMTQANMVVKGQCSSCSA